MNLIHYKKNILVATVVQCANAFMLFNNQALHEFTAVSKKCCGQGLRLMCVNHCS